MALTEREFRMIKRKMDKINVRLNEMYQNWHAEYGSATSIEECEEIKNFYKPYMDKYESKFRILYQLLQQPRSVPTHDDTSGITPSLVALDDATSLKQRSKQREEVPKQYTTIEGHLTPHTPRSEDMRLEHSLTVTPEGLLDTIPAVAQRETLDISSETTYMEIPNTQVETIPGEVTVPKTTQGTKETSRAEVLASTQQFFAAIDQRDLNVPSNNQLATVSDQNRDVMEGREVPTTTVPITSVTITSPSITNVAVTDTSGPRVCLPESLPPHPTITATCRPRTWMQQLTEGQTTEPQREGTSSSEHEVSMVETLPEDIPDELGQEWRVLHPFDLPGVRLPSETTPSNQRHLAENDALVELIQTTEYLDDVPTWGQRDYRLYPPHYRDPFYRGRGRGRGRGGRGRREWLTERQMERPNGGFSRGNGHTIRPQQPVSIERPITNRQDDEWSSPPPIDERRSDMDRCQTESMSFPAAPPPTEERVFTDWSSEGPPRERSAHLFEQPKLQNHREQNQI